MREHIKNWLQFQQKNIEQLICEAAQNFVHSRYKDLPDSNFLYDLKQCEKESLALSNGGDLCYDRYTMGMSYALWYQGRRINTSLSYCIDLVVEAIEKNEPIEVFDLGAGTGAVQIAIGLCLEAASLKNCFLPKVRIINIDISPFMLDFHRTFLSQTFRKHYSSFSSIYAEYSVNSWINPEQVHLQNPCIVASYLFDHEENKKDIAEHFNRLVERHHPARVVLLTSNQYVKRQFLDEISKEISANEYRCSDLPGTNVFVGSMDVINEYRQQFNQQFGDVLSGNTPNWHERSFYGKILINTRPLLGLEGGLFAEEDAEINHIDLYMPPIKVRRDIHLNEEQQRAAEPNDRSTIITGPAGCGKSVVLTERIKNICNKTNYYHGLNILLTTFNKDLIGYLGSWLKNILDAERVTHNDNNEFFFDDSEKPNIRLLHFDVLPTRLGNIHGSLLKDEGQQKYYLEKAVKQVVAKRSLDWPLNEGILNLDFLLDEYVRVIYGQQYDKPSKYQEGSRLRRPYRNLEHNSLKRTIIWEVIRTFLEILEEKEKETIHTRRHKFLRVLQRGQSPSNSFSHLFVDEFQDCTQADYEIFYRLLADYNQLVIAGDYAQAVHLGSSAEPPRVNELFEVESRMSNKKNIQLQGSYRLPFRISECIRPLSEKISSGRKEVDIISPYKGAPPGARPVVIYAADVDEMAQKLSLFFWQFQLFDLFDPDHLTMKKVTILEKDTRLCGALNQKIGGISEAATILRLKGMEKDCIIWSTRKSINEPDDVYFYIYTILTRTSSVLVIALFDDMPDYVREVLHLLKPERLMFWDKASEQAYQRAIREIAITALMQ